MGQDRPDKYRAITRRRPTLLTLDRPSRNFSGSIPSDDFCDWARGEKFGNLAKFHVAIKRSSVTKEKGFNAVSWAQT